MRLGIFCISYVPQGGSIQKSLESHPGPHPIPLWLATCPLMISTNSEPRVKEWDGYVRFLVSLIQGLSLYKDSLYNPWIP